MLSAERVQIALPRGVARPRSRVRARVSPLLFSLVIAAAAGAIVLVRSLTTWSADGDPALHLRLIKDIATTWELPRHLPNHPARIGEGGAIEAMFPYGYTPLYHVTGAAMYSIAGVTGVLMLNAVGAAAIAFVLSRFVGRTAPLYVATAAVVCAALSPRVQQPFTSVYMEPLVLGLVFACVWTLYLALTRRSPLQGLAAGACIGLAVAMRQSALIYGVAIAAVVALHMLDRRVLRRPNGGEMKVVLAASAGAAAMALPALVYLWSVTGSIGYGDMRLPGTAGAVAIDPVANAYVAGISKPDGSIFIWLDRYQRILFYGERWLPTAMFGVLVLLFAAGIVHLHSRGRAGRFFARWVVAQCAVEMLIFVTVHGNARYIMLSQMLFYAVIPVGAYAAARWCVRTGEEWPRLRIAGAAGVVVVVGAAALAMAPPAYIETQYAQPVDPLRAFRARAYAEAGAWVNENTRPESLFLVPRAYSAELTWERNVTWVTFYGNMWVVDAMREADPARAHAILSAHGVDYVVVQDPTGTYIDRMPASGMRTFLQLGRTDSPYFTLAYVTSDSSLEWNGREVEHGLRIYRVTPLAMLQQP